MWAARIAYLFLGTGVIFAQSGIVEQGHQLYRANCSNCHGEGGENIVGVDLGHGKFKRATTDEELSTIVIKGIPGTGMPPASIQPPQALMIVSYLRSLAPVTAAGGDPARGEALFASKGCTGCHRVLGLGSRVAPDLSEIGSFRRPADFEQSLLDPDADIQPDNRTFHAVTKEGASITGRVINEDGFSYQIIDSKERLLSLDKADLRERSFAKTSGMPSYKGKLTPQELSDLVSYLGSLKRMDSK